MIIVIKPGMQTTIQDLGRTGYQRLGISVTGAIDSFSHRIANLLVGNDEALPTLEATMIGPRLLFECDAVISLCGGDMHASIDDHIIEMWRPYHIQSGQQLICGTIQNGSRIYIAINGGWNVPSVLNSNSTHLKGGFGGFHGRSLKRADILTFKHLNDNLKRSKLNWSLSPELRPRFSSETTIQVMKGKHFHLFNEESQQTFFHRPFEVTHQSDRMGARLKGPELNITEASELLSEAVSFGTIQVPSGGQPIVLLADRQTTGGYPLIAQIATVDFSKIAQTKAGDQINFRCISHENAQQQFLQFEKRIAYIKQGILLKLQ